MFDKYDITCAQHYCSCRRLCKDGYPRPRCRITLSIYNTGYQQDFNICFSVVIALNSLYMQSKALTSEFRRYMQLSPVWFATVYSAILQKIEQN